MKATFAKIAVIACTGLGLFGVSPSAQAQSFRHIDELALRLQRQAEQMHDEVHAHFRNTRFYRHLDQDVTQMERLARHIHEVAHDGGNISHIRSDLRELDRLFHHIEDVVRQMTFSGQLDLQTIRHFRRNLAGISDTLHHLRDDLRPLDHGHGHGGIGGGFGRGGIHGSIRLPFGSIQW